MVLPGSYIFKGLGTDPALIKAIRDLYVGEKIKKMKMAN